ncbi:hypothetical protein [Streptomyces sp. NBC_00334]|uniref:hypothetical protein n=1 Tax=Streptomyces sp. NBC_00334 TaxID=2975713 RepID=UPI002E2B0278|nr:hypothetical protein [Streptomyces sp. NBC_00334]
MTAGTGLSVTIRADVAASVRGHGWYSGGDSFSVPLSANISSQARIDSIVLRLDRTDWTVTAAVVGGTPGSGAPALTQDPGATGLWEIPLAQARVLGGASSVTVTRAEQYCGTRCRPCTSTTRNPYPRMGEQCFETDTKRLMLWDGSAWQVVYQDSGEISLQTVSTPGWAVEGESIVQIKNGSAHVRLGAFRRTSASSEGAETRLPIFLPASCQPPKYWQYPLVYLGGARLGRLTVYSRTHAKAGQVWLTEHAALAKDDYVVSSTTSWAV